MVDKMKMEVDLPSSNKEDNLLEIIVEGMNHKNIGDLNNDKKGLYGNIWFNDF